MAAVMDCLNFMLITLIFEFNLTYLTVKLIAKAT